MNEVTKLYENIGVTAYIYCSKPQLDCDARETGNCKQDCEYYSGERSLAPFTAEKQIELIKWLARFDVRIEYTNAKYFIESHYHGYSVYTECFEQALAGFINILWQDLTEQERTEIRSILNG